MENGELKDRNYRLEAGGWRRKWKIENGKWKIIF
jgi:hypothetical protein